MEARDLFVKKDKVELEVEGFKFGYIPTDGNDENNWLKDYLKTNPKTGVRYQDQAELNKCKLRNIIEVPFDKVLIKELIGVEKEWSKLDKDQRYTVLGKLRPTVFGQLIIEIEKVDRPSVKKDSSSKSADAIPSPASP